MSWIAGGLFTPMFHAVEDDAREMEFDDRRFSWSRCDALCVVLPIGFPIKSSEVPWCNRCFPDRASFDAAIAAWASGGGEQEGEQQR